MKHRHKAILLAVGLVSLTNCATLNYYGQAVNGQWQILQARKPISTYLTDHTTPATLKDKLQHVLDIRHFAKTTLKLPVDGSYSDYVDLGREYVVWNVFAAPPFSVDAKTWCFPIAGCVKYKGFFAQVDAQQEAAQLKQHGYEVYVGGVAAYSTLGWFDDPVLNTFIRRSDRALTALLIHELAHKKLYVQNDSTFNESFASSVEWLGSQQFLRKASHITPLTSDKTNATLTDNQQAQYREARYQQHQAFLELVLTYRDKLKSLYSEHSHQKSLSAPIQQQLTTQKAQIIAELRKSYQALKNTWLDNAHLSEQDANRYDGWFAGPLNNAQLSTIATYNTWVPAFIQLFNDNKKAWPAFYNAAKKLSELPPDIRTKQLEQLKARYQASTPS